MTNHMVKNNISWIINCKGDTIKNINGNKNSEVYWTLYSLIKGCAEVVFGPLGTSGISNLQI